MDHVHDREERDPLEDLLKSLETQLQGVEHTLRAVRSFMASIAEDDE